METTDKKMMSIEKELEMAEAYAEPGHDMPKNYMERCLDNAIRLSKEQGMDISNKVEIIRKIRDSHK